MTTYANASTNQLCEALANVLDLNGSTDQANIMVEVALRLSAANEQRELLLAAVPEIVMLHLVEKYQPSDEVTLGLLFQVLSDSVDKTIEETGKHGMDVLLQNIKTIRKARLAAKQEVDALKDLLSD